MCCIPSIPMCIILYADDILLLAPSVNALQLLLSTCELELRKLDLFINSAKSVCLRIGPIESAGHFRCSHEVAKKKFYSSFNGIFGKIGRVASEKVMVLNLISAKCIPCLLYASEALPFNSSQLKSLGFPLKRVLFKMFKTGSSDIVSQCQEFF